MIEIFSKIFQIRIIVRVLRITSNGFNKTLKVRNWNCMLQLKPTAQFSAYISHFVY